MCTPKPNGFADHYPVFKWLFHWEYNLFSDKSIYRYWSIASSLSTSSSWSVDFFQFALLGVRWYKYYFPAQSITCHWCVGGSLQMSNCFRMLLELLRDFLARLLSRWPIGVVLKNVALPRKIWPVNGAVPSIYTDMIPNLSRKFPGKKQLLYAYINIIHAVLGENMLNLS